MNWNALWILIAPYAVVGIVALAMIGITLWVLKYRKSNLAQINFVIEFIRANFSDKLGDKADKILALWYETIKEVVTSGDFTPEEMVQFFWSVFAGRLEKNNIQLNSSEEEFLQASAVLTVSALSTPNQAKAKNEFEALTLKGVK